MSIITQIEERIKSFGRGSIFYPDDFMDLGTSEAIRQSLTRLSKDEKIVRVAQGIYCYPQIDEELGLGIINTGGIVGRNFGKISGCKTEGTVTGGESNVGGIVGNGVPNYDTGTGNFIGSTIEGCYSTAAVSGYSLVGGVVGNLGNNCSLMACYSTGSVTATWTSRLCRRHRRFQ